MPAGVSIDIARDTPLSGPEFFYLGSQRGPARAGQEPVDHTLPVRALIGVGVWRPRSGDSEAARALAGARLVDFRDADDYLLELRFDSSSHGRADLRPALPLTLVW